MGLSKKDKEFLANINKPQQPPFVDLFFKGVATVSMALILWIFSTTDSLKNDVSIMKNNIEHINSDLKELKSFAKQPRFTYDDFLNNINPIITNVNKNTLELNQRNEFMKDVESRLIKLEIKNKNK